jgi:hypothetical protein
MLVFLPLSIILHFIPIKFETLKPPNVHGRLSEQFLGPQAAFGTTFKVTGVQVTIGKPEQANWKGIKEGFSQLVSNFIEASRNFILKVLHTAIN